ncbi:hypothetical protein QZH41_001715 [Actinostola sp. cb2023]|nr:hypothetical protein QZH41_001715 [Actinostola sp. cb2023]
MENYVLYDEIGRGERSIVYKGRKKGTIEFVAIHCVDKSKRFELRNMVRLTHDMTHPNVVRFYEWYETTNHIWMVVELCTGYNLGVLISQDQILPEETVKHFTTEIVKALFYVHSLGVVYCDLQPSKILLDGPGHLKLSDFALSRVEGEDEIFDLVLDDDDDDDEKDDVKDSTCRFPKPSPNYMAPELLWKLFTHCTADNQKVTAISALCRLTCHSVNVFQCVVEKAGFKTVLDAFSSGVSQVQQAILTMFAALLSSKPQAKRAIQEKDLVGKVMRLLESPSPIIRGKAFLLIMAVIQGSRESLLTCCQTRLVLHIEKDQKRGTPMKGEVPENQVYLMHCLHNCMASVVEVALNILDNVLSSLSAVEGRRHPSATHTKQLRTHLPNLPIILHLITSHVFRSLIVTDSFLSNTGTLLGYVKSIDCGDTNVGTAAGPTAAEDLTYVVLSVVECITQHPPLLLEYAVPISDHILPVLIELVQSANGNTRVLCFRLFSEIISEKLLPQYHIILQDQNPLPAYGLKLLSSLVERCPDSLQAFLDQDLVSSLLQIVNSHSHEGNASMTQTIVDLLRNVLVTKDVDMAVLYQQGLIDAVKSLFLDVPTLLNDIDQDDTGIPILHLLDTLYVILRYVSKEVRHALHERSKGSTESDSLNQAAEVLLMNTKPIADVTGVLISFLGNEDSKVQEGACKNLYLMG